MNDKERRDGMIVRAIISSSIMFLMFVTAIAFAVATDIPTFDKAPYLFGLSLSWMFAALATWVALRD